MKSAARKPARRRTRIIAGSRKGPSRAPAAGTRRDPKRAPLGQLPIAITDALLACFKTFYGPILPQLRALSVRAEKGKITTEEELDQSVALLVEYGKGQQRQDGKLRPRVSR